jgi:hypothetical protein
MTKPSVRVWRQAALYVRAAGPVAGPGEARSRAIHDHTCHDDIRAVSSLGLAPHWGQFVTVT